MIILKGILFDKRNAYAADDVDDFSNILLQLKVENTIFSLKYSDVR